MQQQPRYRSTACRQKQYMRSTKIQEQASLSDFKTNLWSRQQQLVTLQVRHTASSNLQPSSFTFERPFFVFCSCSSSSKHEIHQINVLNKLTGLTYHRRYTTLIASNYSAFNVKSPFPTQQTANLSALSMSSPFTCRARDKLETDVLQSYTVKINGS